MIRVGNVKGQQRDAIPGLDRLFSDAWWYGVSGQEDNTIGKGRSGHGGTVLDNPRLTML